MRYVTAQPQLTPGMLVNARKRDWIVLPSADSNVLRLRPLTGGDDDGIGVFLPLEGRDVKPASFAPPDPAQAGDTMGGLLLRDAARLSLRAGAGPFRSLGHLSVSPRPYQFVPLIMALRLDPVRLLIADDVGVGKTIEAGMIARELLDRGDARRFAVVCPAHLCDQWARELHEKFALDAVVLQPATIGRLERALPRSDLSIYQYYRHLVVSIDWVKSERNRAHFLDNAPDLIIVDEAHIASRPPSGIGGGSAQHQRYELVRALAADAARHLILVTATPHSGVEESFRSLLGLLDRQFDGDTFGDLDRKALLPHMVQRRRRDVQQWLGTDTPFPERRATERRYALSPAYHRLFDEVLAYCRETVGAEDGAGVQQRRQQRVRHWAAIAILRCVLSSPAAATAVLGERARRQGLAETEQVGLAADTDEDVDGVYAPQVLDALDGDVAPDYTPTAPLEEAESHLDERERRRLSEMLRRAKELAGPEHDLKLVTVADALAELLRDSFRPIVFCRFIATAKYLETWLPRRLKQPGVRVVAVTGEIGDEERRARIHDLVEHPTRVLVATDCLSEGINLQEHFDAVLHYDLPWNPNRLEQREGRVDRFGQSRAEVRTELLYGADNQVDLVVRDVLIEKARTIRRRLGVAVPVPAASEQVVQAVVDSVLLRGGNPRDGSRLQMQLPFVDEEVSQLHEAWDQAAEREGRQRAYFAQHAIRPDEVARELEETDPVLGDGATVRHFLAEAAQRFGGELHRPIGSAHDGVYTLVPGDDMLRALKARGYAPPLRVAFSLTPATLTPATLTPDRGRGEKVTALGRTHPIVESYCNAVLGAALAPQPDRRFARCGAIVTNAVSGRTAIVLLRLRYLLHERSDGFAEEVVLAAFERREGAVVWLDPPNDRARLLLEEARPVVEMSQPERRDQVAWALRALDAGGEWWAPLVEARVRALQESHARLRSLVKAPRLTVQPHTPPDILGCYVLVPGRRQA